MQARHAANREREEPFQSVIKSQSKICANAMIQFLGYFSKCLKLPAVLLDQTAGKTIESLVILDGMNFAKFVSKSFYRDSLAIPPGTD